MLAPQRSHAGVEETRAHEDGLGIGGGALAALFYRELWRTFKVNVIGIELELERQASGEVSNRRNGLESLSQTLFHEQIEAISLDFEEIRQRVGFTQS